MSVQVGRLSRKRRIKKMDGSLFEWYDESLENPWVVRGGRVMQPELYKEEMERQRKEKEDAKLNLKAMQNMKEREPEPQEANEDVESLIDKKLDEKLDKKFDELLAKLNKAE